MLASDVADELVTKVKHEDRYAMAIDESIEITDAAQMLIFIQYVSGQKLAKDLFCFHRSKPKATKHGVLVLHLRGPNILNGT